MKAKARIFQTGFIHENYLGGVTVGGWNIDGQGASDPIPVLQILPNGEVLILGVSHEAIDE